MTDPITVFTARRIHTMDPSLPEATAIAVRDGRIIEVGNLESLQPWLTRHEHRVDDRFAEQVLVPGLIDPHVHPSMMAGLLACERITGADWDLPECHVPAVIGAEAFMDRVRDLEAGLPDGVFNVLNGDRTAVDALLTKVATARDAAIEAADGAEEAATLGVTVSATQVRSSGAQLKEVGRLLDDGSIRVVVDSTYSLADARKAHERAAQGHVQGKIVLTVE